MKNIKASWYNPRTGVYNEIGNFNASGLTSFEPQGDKTTGNDWVLILEETNIN
jgi:hypothetical protein